ncbi:kinase-like domain-containing protein [Trichoderma sp. SZMC 28013]
MDQLIDSLDAVVDGFEAQKAKMPLEVKKETGVFQAATKTRVQKVNYRDSTAQIKSRDGRAQELATLEESVKTLADYSETKIESHVEAAFKEMLQIKRRLEAAGELSEAHAADFNNPAIQISSHVAKALKEMSKIKESLEAKRELKAKKEALVLEIAPEETKVQTIVTALAEASLSEPDVRLVIAYPRRAADCPRGDYVIPLKKKLGSKDFFAVIQSKEDISYTFSLPSYNWSSRFIPDELHIFYDPQSDNCVVEITVASRDKYSLTKSNTKLHLTPGERQTIKPGVWSISVEDDIHRPSIEILLLKRRFNISICDAKSASLKREAADYIRRDRATKRPKNEGLGTYVVSHAASVLPMQFGVNTHNRIITRKIVDKAIATVMNLQDGHTAVIRSQIEEEAYHLQRKHEIFTSKTTHVFSCELSRMPGKIIAAKVLCNNTSTVSVNAIMWHQEKEILKKLNHSNIVKLIDYDARLFTLYQEYLPLSLGHEKQIQPPFDAYSTRRILQDMASALVYLTKQGIVHCDIKPANIAYSTRRGAVLLDFGASYNVKSYVRTSGTPWYLPPEYLHVDERGHPCPRRGFPGDIWALGVTMLYLLGKCRPEKTKNWLVGQVYQNGPDRARMQSWIKSVAEYRKQLEEADDGIGRLVSQMLHDIVQSRVTAAELQAKVFAVKGVAKQ